VRHIHQIITTQVPRNGRPRNVLPFPVVISC